MSAPLSAEELAAVRLRHGHDHSCLGESPRVPGMVGFQAFGLYVGETGDMDFGACDAARLIATLDAERDRARSIGTMTEEALTPTGDHHILPGGYCLDCQGGCIVPLAEANTEAIRQAAYVKPDPFFVAVTACRRRAVRVESAA